MSEEDREKSREEDRMRVDASNKVGATRRRERQRTVRSTMAGSNI